MTSPDAPRSRTAVVDERATLVICTRDRAELLADAVASVLAGNRLPWEILIVDQSDTADPAWTTASSTPCTVRYHHVPARGLSRARNEAISIVTTPITVWTDDDVVVTPDWLGSLVDAVVAAGPQFVVTGRVRPGDERGESGFVPTLKGGDVPVAYSGRIMVDPLTTFNMALYRAPLEGVGGFDERLGPGTDFPGGEDNDLAFRLLKAGYTIVYDPDAVVQHRAWRPPQGYVALRWRYGRGQGAFLATHLTSGNRHIRRRLIGTVVRLGMRAPARLWRHAPGPGRRLTRVQFALGDLAMLAGVVSGVLEWKRRHGREGAWRGMR